MEIKNTFWKDKHVLLTGHTGFKGSWLSMWLNILGAKVTGLALDPYSEPNLFDILNLSEKINDLRGDIRSIEKCKNTINDNSPEIIVANDSGNLYCFNTDGSISDHFPIQSVLQPRV